MLVSYGANATDRIFDQVKKPPPAITRQRINFFRCVAITAISDKEGLPMAPWGSILRRDEVLQMAG